MKDRMERFVILPFSLGCSTQSSVAVVTTHQHKKPNQLIKSTYFLHPRREETGENGSVKKECTKMENNGVGANTSDGREESDENGSFKKEYTKMDNNGANISDGYEEETKEREAEMEIGFPTDVKHLSHIGIDGIMTTFDHSSSSFPFSGFQLTTTV
ncbi:PREDICTED: CRIB domain-containing protein RIC2-like isoform X3 [Camelina sativa]|uniref:CRIB domain-containing protein RIC2-like isoform X3 n=1 Tax=Camelina sativa TaxID=90675 RepID=A0ABM0WYQ1_CAMSA|nr:PREDICTED: CRIB domain-containing protein RIC2-like isoform X3 [Camelina sativa]